MEKQAVLLYNSIDYLNGSVSKKFMSHCSFSIYVSSTNVLIIILLVNAITTLNLLFYKRYSYFF